jgi:DNA-binding NarL/FixJ family response regulator
MRSAAVPQRCQPDGVVLDLHLPDISGVEVARRLRVSSPDTTIVVLSGYDDIGYQRAIASAIRAALALGRKAPQTTRLNDCPRSR